MLSLIAAMDENRLIGKGQQLPWSLPADLRHFKRITWGKVIIMGRITYESIGKALPGRTNIVLSHTAQNYPDCLVCNSLEDALHLKLDEKELFVIGGATLYEQALPLASRLYLTRIHHAFDGDTYFPQYDSTQWEVIEQEEFIMDAQNPYAYTFQTLKRK